jgi:hypothetical protein
VFEVIPLFESSCKHRIELRKHGKSRSRAGSPAAILERGDGQSKFEFQRIFRMKIAATVTAKNFELSIDGFDSIGGGERFSYRLGIF